MIKFLPPNLNDNFVIVASDDRFDLTAVVLSYLFEPGNFLPIFSMNNVEVPNNNHIDKADIYAIQRRRAEIFGVFLSNALIELERPETVFLVGLNENQKTYLDFLEHYNVISLDDFQDAEMKLMGFAPARRTLECALHQVMEGLIYALRTDSVLKIGTQNFDLPNGFKSYDKGGIIVIENNQKSRTVLAVNYACSVDADIKLVDPLLKDEEDEILGLIENWNEGNELSLQALKDKVVARVNDIIFNSYSYVTFFTEGLPYSVNDSDIPCSYVHLDYHPDFFIFRAFMYEKYKGIGSAVVFSPQFFKDEETKNLISLFEFENFYTRSLLNDNASVYNLGSTIENFPFDLLHVSSHGGSVEGTRCLVKFNDAEGHTHEIEFDEVLSISLDPNVDSHKVETLWYFREFNGLKWRSEELRAMNYPHELYAMITTAISKAYDDKSVKKLYSIPKVANSNNIQCAHFAYSANFDQTGGNVIYPFIFNNSCWSWNKISANFLANGARGYVGTLSTVQNDLAVDFAGTFYSNVFSENIIEAFHKANLEYINKTNKGLYIYWGLHFSTIKNDRPVDYNRGRVIGYLTEHIKTWQRKLRSGQGDRKLIEPRIRESFDMYRQVLRDL